jgi:hypothetical protein
VRNGDSWESIASRNGLAAWDLIEANFRTRDPAEVNWYLHHYTGCTQTTADGRNWVFSSSANPGVIHIPRSGYIHLTVPMRPQGPNPICWIACVAMISSYKGRTSMGIGDFTGGLDPSSASVANPAAGWPDQYARLRRFGFVNENPFRDRSPDAAYIARMLHQHGPFMLTHFATDLLPGAFAPNTTHAIVITGIDMDTGRVWYNNPWGNADVETTVDSILRSMENLLSRGIDAVAYMP